MRDQTQHRPKQTKSSKTVANVMPVIRKDLRSIDMVRPLHHHEIPTATHCGNTDNRQLKERDVRE